MIKYIRDISVLAVISILCGILGSAIMGWTGYDTKYVTGFFTAAVFYDWYKKAK